MNRVSIIIACYNDGRYLPEALAAARAQDYPEVEIIVVDDHSTDEATLELLAREAAAGLTVLKTPAGRKGPSAARNVGIAAASGVYILPLDADDAIAPDYAAQAAAVLSSSPDVALCYGRGRYFGLKKGPIKAPPYAWGTLLTGNIIFNSALYRRADWEKIGGYDESLTLALEDYAFWLKLLANGGRAVRLEREVYFYRIKPRSRSVAIADDQRLRTALEALFQSCPDLWADNAGLLAAAAHQLRLEQDRLAASWSWKMLAPLYRAEQKIKSGLKKMLRRA